MTSDSKRLIELHLSGKSAAHVIDALLEELPAYPVVRQTILHDLPKGSDVTIDDGVVYIVCEDRDLLRWKLPYFESMYPELDFVTTNRKDDTGG